MIGQSKMMTPKQKLQAVIAEDPDLHRLVVGGTDDEPSITYHLDQDEIVHKAFRLVFPDMPCLECWDAGIQEDCDHD